MAKDQAAAQATPAPETPKEDFDQAFEKLAEMVEPTANPEVLAQPVDKPADTTAEAPAQESEKEKPEDEEDSEEAEESDEDEEEEDDEEEESEEEEDEVSEVATKKAKKNGSESDEKLLERFAEIVKEKAIPSQPQVQQPTPQQAPPMFSKDEEEFLTTYEKEWPDIAKAETLRRRAEYKELVGYIFSEIAKEISPVLESVKTISERTHLQDLQSTVTDYDDVRDKVVDWVGKQPAYLQPAYNHVIQQGTVDEVVDLINRYKADTGVKVAQAPSSPPARKKMDTELPSATKQAAASLAPVSSKRSAVIAGVDSGDFESAFAAFADKL